MQLINIAMARSIWLFDVNALNPHGKHFLPYMIKWLKDKYQFEIFPSSVMDVDKQTNGLMFRAGRFQGANGKITVNIGIFTDGVTAETWSSTRDGDDLLEEALRDASNQFGLAYSPGIVRAKRYLSEVVVHMEPLLSSLNPKVENLAKKLSEMFERANLGNFEFSGLVFLQDTSGTVYKPPGFVIERKAEAPFNERRYYSKSPFTTEEHLSALGDLENLLRAAEDQS